MRASALTGREHGTHRVEMSNLHPISHEDRARPFALLTIPPKEPTQPMTDRPRAPVKSGTEGAFDVRLLRIQPGYELSLNQVLASIRSEGLLAPTVPMILAFVSLHRSACEDGQPIAAFAEAGEDAPFIEGGILDGRIVRLQSITPKGSRLLFSAESIPSARRRFGAGAIVLTFERRMTESGLAGCLGCSLHV